MASSSDSKTFFPAVINAHGHWGFTKHFNLCGETKNAVFAVVDVHTGFSSNGALGTRPGHVLHAGSDKKGPVMGAVGDEAMSTARHLAFNRNSVILLPPLFPGDMSKDVPEMQAEMMRANTDGDRVVFSFSIETGKDLKREKFQWQKIIKNEDENAKLGGYKLVWLKSTSASPENEQAAGSSTTDGNNNNTNSKGSHETVAMLAWKSTWFSTHFFELRFTGSGKMGQMGERWALMTVLTALRLFSLKVTGRSTTKFISAGEKLRKD